MTLKINKPEINIREEISKISNKVTFDEVVRGLGEYTGNVGIGTTSPNISQSSSGSTVLTVSASETSRVAALELKGTRGRIGDVVGYLRTFNNAGTTPITDIQSIRGAGGDGELLFRTSNVDAMTIDSSGNVGIGTTTPNAKITAASKVDSTFGNVTPSVSDCVISLTNQPTTEAENNHASLQFNLNAGTLNHVASISLVSESATLRRGALAFCTDNGTNRPEAMRIDSDGNVGIGTTSPSAKLEIGQSDGNSGITLNYIPSTYPNRYKSDLYHDGAGNLKIESWAGSATTAGDILLAPNGGNVGIGITNPDCKLTVITDSAPSGYSMKVSAGGGNSANKAIYIAAGKTDPTGVGHCIYIGFHDGNGSASGGIRNSSTATTPEFFSGSDIRMKKNIEDCDINGIEKIKSLKLRKWEWNTERDIPSTDLGLVADELEQVFPELISRQELEGWEHCVAEGEEPLKTVPSESKITLTLVKAIQEQQSIIEDLKSRIETLESK